MEPSLQLARFVARREGIVTVPYRDGDGYSIGAGHFMGKKPTRQSITAKEAVKLVLPHLKERAPFVSNLLTVPIQQHQFDAILDLYYQGGKDGLVGDDKLGLSGVIKIINARDPKDPLSVLASDRETAKEILNWDMSADGTHMPGLLKRAGRRVAIYTAADYGSDLDLIPMWDRVDEETGKVRAKDMKMVKVSEGDFL
jgi:GH24 family phage-related lysozyme (muramidase)